MFYKHNDISDKPFNTYK